MLVVRYGMLIVEKETENSIVVRQFQHNLLNWFEKNRREYPWRNTKDPFCILVAEICLKRTGAWKAEAAYNQIMQIYPTPELMSKANVEELREHFVPLGLTSRAELLIELAQEIGEAHSGSLPESYEGLVSLKGVGQYIANAILLFGYDQSSPLIDEGIARVYRRAFGLKSAKPAYADKELWSFAEKLLPDNHSVSDYSWALLDLSALTCTPQKPRCPECPVSDLCCFADQEAD